MGTFITKLLKRQSYNTEQDNNQNDMGTYNRASNTCRQNKANLKTVAYWGPLIPMILAYKQTEREGRNVLFYTAEKGNNYYSCRTQNTMPTEVHKKLKQFEDNDGRKLPLKYIHTIMYLLRCWIAVVFEKSVNQVLS